MPDEAIETRQARTLCIRQRYRHLKAIEYGHREHSFIFVYSGAEITNSVRLLSQRFKPAI